MSDPDDTAARLVLAAEDLFAAGGEEATSLRAVTRAARSNAAAVHYHFGGRDQLLRAVLERHLAPLAARRSALLDAALVRFGDPVPVAALLDAVVRPDLELLASLRTGRVQVARLLGRSATGPGTAVATLVAHHLDALASRVVPMLAATLPTIDPAELDQRLRLVHAGVAQTFATVAGAGEPGPFGTDDVPEQVRRLVAFAAGGLSAPGTLKLTKKRKKR